MTLAELSVLLPDVVKGEVMELKRLKSQVDEGFIYSCSATIRRYIETKLIHLEHQVKQVPVSLRIRMPPLISRKNIIIQ